MSGQTGYPDKRTVACSSHVMAAAFKDAAVHFRYQNTVFAGFYPSYLLLMSHALTNTLPSALQGNVGHRGTSPHDESLKIVK